MLTLICCQDHILTEYIWFVWSETSYSGDERRCHRCGTNNQTNKRATEYRATQPMEVGGWVSQLDNSKLCSTQQQKICWHWHVARIISSQKICGLYARKHHIVEMRGNVTDAWRTNERQQQLKIELLSQWKLEAESRKCLATKQHLSPQLIFCKRSKTGYVSDFLSSVM